MKILIIGSTGMLGNVLVEEALSRGHEVVGASRSNADILLDFNDINSLVHAVHSASPEMIINAGALVSLDECERDPAKAYIINARPAAVLARLAAERNIYFVQISTDHYYSGDHKILHDEASPVRLLNEYARTKYAGEIYALTHSRSLIVRTNIVGFKNRRDSLTFIEWVIDSLKSERKMTLFYDFYTSSMTARQLSKVLLDTIETREVYGTINIASREASSKKRFIECFAQRFGYRLMDPECASVHSLSNIRRADSLGLDVSKVERIVGYSMPNLDEVIDQLYAEYQEEFRT
ncbi:SDR family oxidoreductase [Paenibacillus chibensis]|uniref:dTDP-4-dehydrorhamnose reductase n=1 Tax=Paenibacillus chibensis TaxID=59846 RepID=A0ABU6PU67_9BACL|nr:SDR family oxidoreductase [Paenibacillus chibensis]